MIKDRDTNFREHSIFLSEIAQNILDGNDRFLLIPGVREIIALYLLIPYTTNDQLDSGMPSQMPKLDLSEEFINGVNLRNLRDTICHSFVTVEESSKDRLGRIIIDDRAQMTRKTHNEQESKALGVFLEIPQAHKKLKELHSKIIISIK
ncbi:hypothetical protein E0I61_04530 [Flavobacterium ranwuense]|uniref:pEK499-p136 HEPN domain-containing protein n=1 Tax=Flavobacterium ranwuense TaxID=2541725 RepID=A0ABY2DSM9_9FLAO|nr:hypothetical protein [Flavobacterium ranwuense]TDE30263.1 hypothetical protein E0I61_04530 [Flavobacterium ranwuense]